MESASTGKCRDVHLHRLLHLHCHLDVVIVDWDLVDDALGGAVAQSDLEDVLVGVVCDAVPTGEKRLIKFSLAPTGVLALGSTHA